MKDQDSKFLGVHLYPNVPTNSRSSFPQVEENDATENWGKKIRSTKSSIPVDPKLRKTSFLESSAPQRPFVSAATPEDPRPKSYSARLEAV